MSLLIQFFLDLKDREYVVIKKVLVAHSGINIGMKIANMNQD